jgi:hypothetical protein
LQVDGGSYENNLMLKATAGVGALNPWIGTSTNIHDRVQVNLLDVAASLRVGSLSNFKGISTFSEDINVHASVIVGSSGGANESVTIQNPVTQITIGGPNPANYTDLKVNGFPGTADQVLKIDKNDNHPKWMKHSTGIKTTVLEVGVFNMPKTSNSSSWTNRTDATSRKYKNNDWYEKYGNWQSYNGCVAATGNDGLPNGNYDCNPRIDYGNGSNVGQSTTATPFTTMGFGPTTSELQGYGLNNNECGGGAGGETCEPLPDGQCFFTLTEYAQIKHWGGDGAAHCYLRPMYFYPEGAGHQTNGGAGNPNNARDGILHYNTKGGGDGASYAYPRWTYTIWFVQKIDD